MAGTNMESGSTLYRNTHNSIAGVDIKAVFFGVTFGNLQAISYSITREKAPVYTMGSPEVRGYARGKRAIAGNMVFVMFDDHALLGAINEVTNDNHQAGLQTAYKFVSDFDEIRPMTDDLMKGGSLTQPAKYNFGNSDTLTHYQKYATITTGNSTLSNTVPGAVSINPGQAFNSEELAGTTLEENWGAVTPWYSDQIPAFNVVLTGVNEDGFAATMSILGVEILNEGYGISIDDLISEQQMTYVARAIARWRKMDNPFFGHHSLPLYKNASSGNGP